VGNELDVPYENTPLPWGGTDNSFDDKECAAKSTVLEYRPRGARYDATYFLPAEMEAGLENITVCHPPEVSEANVAVASRLPLLSHRLPTWVPRFSAVFQYRMPTTWPDTEGVKLVPSSTLFGSASTTACSGSAVPHSVCALASAAAVVAEAIRGRLSPPAAKASTVPRATARVGRTARGREGIRRCFMEKLQAELRR